MCAMWCGWVGCDSGVPVLIKIQNTLISILTFAFLSSSSFHMPRASVFLVIVLCYFIYFLFRFFFVVVANSITDSSRLTCVRIFVLRDNKEEEWCVGCVLLFYDYYYTQPNAFPYSAEYLHHYQQSVSQSVDVVINAHFLFFIIFIFSFICKHTKQEDEICALLANFVCVFQIGCWWWW